MISEGSCDTEDWSNDASQEKNYIFSHKNSYLKNVLIFHSITVLCHFNEINAALVSRKDSFEKHSKLLNGSIYTNIYVFREGLTLLCHSFAVPLRKRFWNDIRISK